MATESFPPLDNDALPATRDALHACARVMGDCLKANRPRRKHWWHASLRLSLRGITTGLVRADVDFEIELDMTRSQLILRTADSAEQLPLSGQSEHEIAMWLDSAGVQMSAGSRSGADFAAYSSECARQLHGALASVGATLEDLRAGIREETSPIQVWPHHFDLSMIWLPGTLVDGQDPGNEEYADQQMNFGFVFGDDGIEEPYLYVTAYPLPEAMPVTPLPDGANWNDDQFGGAIIHYRQLLAQSDPAAYLQDVWSRLLEVGRMHLGRRS